MTLLPWMVGCAQPPASPPLEPELVQQPVATVQDVSDWVYDEGQQELPPLDLPALEAALEEAALAVLVWDAQPVIEAYSGVLVSSGSLACPPLVEDGYGNTYWQGYCESDDGTTFGGYLSDYGYDSTYDPYSDMFLTGRSLAGNVALQGPLGLLDLEGQASFIEGVSSDGSLLVVSSTLYGGFYGEGPAGAGWLGSLQDAASLSVSLFGYTLPAVGGILVGAEGSVVVGEHAVIFHGMQMGNAQIGSLCATEPGGTAEMRDAYGRWVDIVFHGPQAEIDGGDPQQCDGCGDVTWEGEPVGQVCPDLTPWYQWELLP
jgi:hypothetical protein